MSTIVERLRELGATEAQIEDALARHDMSVGSDLVLLRSASLSANDLSAAAGETTEDVIDTYRQLGVAVEDPDAILFNEAEVELVQILRAVTGDVYNEDEGSDILRVAATAFARISDTAVNNFASGVEERQSDIGVSDDEILDAQLEIASIGEATTRVIGHVLTHHFRLAAQRQRQSMSAAESRQLSRYAIGFIDLAGYTEHSAGLEPSELSDFVRRFEVAAFELATDHGARIVKHIGDEVMFAAIGPADGCRLAQALIDTFRSDDVAARGGLAYGDLLSRRGDFYGPVVNLASRLTDEAVDGEVLVDVGLHEAVAGHVELEAAGRRKLKGFGEPVRVWSLAST